MLDTLYTILSVWANNINFLPFHFYVSIGMLLKGTVESSLLSKDELLTQNIDKNMAV